MRMYAFCKRKEIYSVLLLTVMLYCFLVNQHNITVYLYKTTAYRY